MSGSNFKRAVRVMQFRTGLAYTTCLNELRRTQAASLEDAVELAVERLQVRKPTESTVSAPTSERQ